MGTYAGAVAAIEQRLRDNWTTTRIVVQNETPEDPWPPVVSGGGEFPALAPWIMLEVRSSFSELHGAGKPGAQLWQTDGFIRVYVMTLEGTDADLALTYATEIGEIFRGTTFYDNGDGCYVRTWAPRIDESRDVIGETDQGNWYGVTMAVPFEYWHQG